MKIFICGPMTGYPEFNFPAFHEAAIRLTRLGHEVENPAATGIVEGYEWSDYLRSSLAQLVKCEAVYVLPGWAGSKGANLELTVAEGLDMMIMNGVL